MSKAEMKEQIFEVMLEEAVKENFQKELQTLSTAKDLAKELELSQASQKKIEKMIHDANRHIFRQHVRKTAKKAAVIAAIVIPVSVGTLLSVDASRNAIFNALLEWKSDHVDIKYQDGQESSAETPVSGSFIAKPAYLPEGFVETETTKSGPKNIIKYQNDQGITIYFELTPLLEEGTNSLDTERTTKKEIKIHEKEAILFSANTPGENSYLAWKNSTSHFLLISKIAPTELVKIAESIKK